MGLVTLEIGQRSERENAAVESIPNAARPGLSPGLRAALERALGASGVLTRPADLTAYETDWTGQVRGTAAAVLRPSTTAHVSAAVSLCAQAGISIVAQGGHTGLSGGGTPDASGTQVVLSLSRMRAIRALDAIGDTMTVEAGLVLADAQQAAAEAGRLFPLSLASQGSCTIGGNLATNAGGTAVLRYGMARDLVLGLEVVLADGRIWDGLRPLRKDNTGYHLTGLFVGSEGTLGIITAATLRLSPPTPHRATALVALPDVASALTLLGRLREAAGGTLTAFELISRAALEPVLATQAGARDPFSRNHSWYGLVELADMRPTVETTLESTLDAALAEGILLDAVPATNPGVRSQLWALREGITEGERRAGPSLKHDIAVPIPQIPDFVESTEIRLRAALPGVRVAPFGHVGDGNLHYNLGAPNAIPPGDWAAAAPALTAIVVDEVARRGGSISAEHGLGRTKREAARALKSPVEWSVMRALKESLDPLGILNPGVLLPERT